MGVRFLHPYPGYLFSTNAFSSHPSLQATACWVSFQLSFAQLPLCVKPWARSQPVHSLQGTQSAPPSGASYPLPPTRLQALQWLKTCSVYYHSLSAEQELWQLVWVLCKCWWRNKWSRFLQQFLKCVGGFGSIDCRLSFIKSPSCETQKVREDSARTIVLCGVLFSCWTVPCCLAETGLLFTCCVLSFGDTGQTPLACLPGG